MCPRPSSTAGSTATREVLRARLRALSLALLLVPVLLAGCAPEKWKPFQSDQGRFSCLFPGEPQYKTSQAQLPGTLFTLTHHNFTVSPRLGFGGPTYDVGYTDYTIPVKGMMVEFDPDKALDGFRDRILRTHKDKISLVAERPMRIVEHRGREFEFDTPEGLMTTRVFFEKNRGYTLTVVHSKGRDFSREKERFFTSFELVEG